MAHVLLFVGLLTVARRPAAPPPPVSVASFISTTTEVKRWQPQTVQPSTSDVPLPAPVTPAIDTAIPLIPAASISAPMPESINAPEPPAASNIVRPSDQAPKVVESLVYLREPVTRYPFQSRRLREQGVVLLRVVVDERGLPVQVDVERSSGFPRLDEAGREAVMRSRFRPYTEDGVARSAIVVVPIRFALKRR